MNFRRMRIKAILFPFLLFSQFVSAQERNEIIQQRVEFLAEQNSSEEIDLTNVFEQLNYYYEHPINLNHTDAEELRSLGLLTEIQVTDLMLHIRRFGKLITIYELQTLAYWDLQTIQLVRPFVKVDDKLDQLHISFREAIRQGNFEWYIRYQRTPEHKIGYDVVPDSVKATSNKYYYGNADRYYTRFCYTYRTNISIGFTGEKDPGEQFFKGSQKNGFDFYSGHAFYKGGKYIRSIAAGDYLVQIGQGLNTWSGYAFGKTADIFASKKTASLLRPYTSADENRFFRGGAAVFGYRRFSLLAFYSQKRIDGTVAADSLSDYPASISTIDLSGLHRTNREIAKKNQLSERVFGSYLQYTSPRFNAGIAYVDQSYNAPMQRKDLAYNIYAFHGTHTTAISGDYNWVLKNVHGFGEVAYSTHSGVIAQLHGLMLVPNPRVSLSVIYRNYDKAYHSFYNSGFSEGSNTQNEKGLFVGWKVRLTGVWTLLSYADIFTFPWMKYQVDAPSKGHEFLFQPIYRPNKELEIYGRFRQQLREKNSRDSDGTITPLEDVVQRNYRFNLTYKVTEAVSLKSRIEYITIYRMSNKQEKGWLLSQDLVIRPKGSPLDIALRYALFDTDSYDSRIYTYENNALYVFSSPSYYYQGSRAYILVRFSFWKMCDLWVRYGTFIYSNRKTLSSGGEEINGNQKSDVTVQLRLKF